MQAHSSAGECRANVEYSEVEAADRRVEAQLVDALARSRKARVKEMLPDLSHDRLKERCSALDFDDSGRRKADLVARFMAPPAVSKRAAGEVLPSASASAADTSEPPADALSVAEFEQYLWSAADILRGSIDCSDYKTCIFGPLFLKRLSDRFEEECGAMIGASDARQEQQGC